MSQPTPLPKNEHAFSDPEGYLPDILVWREESMLAYGKAEYERGLEDAAQWLENNHIQWDDDIAKCIRTLKGKP